MGFRSRVSETPWTENLMDQAPAVGEVKKKRAVSSAVLAAQAVPRSEPIKGRCNAKTDLGPCRRFPLKGKTRCKKHGGASTGPTPKDGRRRPYTAHLPKGLAELYEQAANDGRGIALEEQFYLLDGMLRGALQDLGAGLEGEGVTAADRWADARELYEAALGADGEEGLADLKRLGELLAAGEDAARRRERAQEDALRIIDTQRKVASVEGRRQALMRDYVPVREVLNLISNLLRAVQDNVTDANARRVIAFEFARHTGWSPPGAGPGAADDGARPMLQDGMGRPDDG
jgi:hypothetical protein